MADPAAGLEPVVDAGDDGPGLYAWRHHPGGHGRPTIGVVVDPGDGITVVDTGTVPSQSAPLADALEPFGVPVKRAVYTSSHIECVGGSPTFWMAARYGRSLTSALLDQPANPAALQRLHPDVADELAEPATRPVSHTVDVAAYLTASHLVVPTSGQMAENLVVVVPDAGVLYAGAMACFGTTPNAFDGDPVAWADALGELSDLAPVVVPGIGPVGDTDDLVALQAYLYACAEADGDVAAIPPGPWDTWSDRRFDEVNVERAAMLAAGDPRVPPSMLRLLGLA